MKPRNHANDGRRFEGLFADVCTAYFHKRVLRLEKCDPPTKIVGPGRIIFLPNPFADYVGTWTERGARSLFIEVKSTLGDKLEIGAKNKLSEKQIDWLLRWHREGAVVGVVWESNFRVGFLPIGRIKDVLDSGRRHIKFQEADPVPQGMGMILFDFAQNLRHWYPVAHANGQHDAGSLATRPG